MSLIILTPATVWNPDALDFRTAPRKLVDRIAILPRREVGYGTIARLIAENQLLRFLSALLPFVLAMVIWPNLAKPISQAPIPMLVFIGFVEMRVLRIPKHKRASLIPEAEAVRTLDMLGFRARRILSRIAARREDLNGELYLVVDQSELAKLTPLTILTVQTGFGDRRILDLDAEERDLIRTELFDDEISEQMLHLTNLREDTYMRTHTYDTRAVTAHARLSARLNAASAKVPAT